jgi:glycogen synthase
LKSLEFISMETITSAPAISAESSPFLKVLAIGSGWFEDQAGGPERVYEALWRSAPVAGLDLRGIIVGPESVRQVSADMILHAGGSPGFLPGRLVGVRRAFHTLHQGWSPDVIAAHCALYAAPVADRLGEVPFIMHFHGPWAEESGEATFSSARTWLKNRLERSVYAKADRVIVLSEALRNVLCDQYGIDDRIVRVIPGGVDVDRFNVPQTREGARETLGWPVDRPIILSVRRLARRMGLDRLIDAMCDVRRHVPEALLLIAGKGPLKEELQSRIDDRALSDHVRLLGYVSDETLPLVYRAADVSVVPTIALEGFGLITLESLAAGTPVLVTPVGGMPEVVAPLSSALVIDGIEVDDLAEALTDSLLGRRKLPPEDACVDHVRQNYRWDVVARQVRGVYEEVL